MANVSGETTKVGNPGSNWWERIAKAEVRVEHLEGYQKIQNGRLASIEHKMDRIQQQLVGVLGMLVVSLVMLVLNFLR